jgi:Ca2+-binding EF-hand superfamily protein
MGRSKPKKVLMQGELPDRVAQQRGFNIINNSMRLSKVLGVEPGQRFTRKDAHRVFDRMDEDGSGEVDYDELQAWVLKSNIFQEQSATDTKKQLGRLFEQIDKNGDRKMDFEEFYNFLQILQREQRLLTRANKHYLTQLPKSQQEMNDKLFTTAYIEQQLHRRIEALTPGDHDRFRTILRMFRTQNAASREELGSRVAAGVVGITKRDFRGMLALLGLSATETQSDLLFDKYDVNQDGCLTVHEFLTRAREHDFPGSWRGPARRYSENKGGKRMYKGGGPGRGGPVERQRTPHPNVSHYAPRHLAQTVRTKLSGSGKVGQVYTDSRGKRDLLKLFLIYDTTNSGIVTNQQFLHVMRMVGVNSVGQSHLEVIFNMFCRDHRDQNKTEVIDYMAFTEFCFPNWDKDPKFYDTEHFDTRGKHYITAKDGTIELRSGRLSRAGSAKLTSLQRPSRGMAHSTSAADLSGRRSGAASRGMSRSATESNLKRPSGRLTPKQEYDYNLAPGQSSLMRPAKMKPQIKPSQNPLMAQMPDDFEERNKPLKNAIMYG